MTANTTQAAILPVIVAVLVLISSVGFIGTTAAQSQETELSLNASNVTVTPGESAEVAFEIENQGTTSTSVDLQLRAGAFDLPAGWEIESFDADGGEWYTSDRYWMSTNELSAGANQTPSIMISVPDNASTDHHILAETLSGNASDTASIILSSDGGGDGGDDGASGGDGGDGDGSDSGNQTDGVTVTPAEPTVSPNGTLSVTVEAQAAEQLRVTGDTEGWTIVEMEPLPSIIGNPTSGSSLPYETGADEDWYYAETTHDELVIELNATVTEGSYNFTAQQYDLNDTVVGEEQFTVEVEETNYTEWPVEERKAQAVDQDENGDVTLAELRNGVNDWSDDQRIGDEDISLGEIRTLVDYWSQG